MFPGCSFYMIRILLQAFNIIALTLFSVFCTGRSSQPLEVKPYSQVKENLFRRGDLDKFYKKLNELENGERKTVRIMFFGDSVIWGDCLTVRLKRRFQSQFGDGGRGLLKIVDFAPTRLYDHKNLTGPGFRRHKIPFESFSIPNLPEIGFTGFSASPVSERSLTVHERGSYSVLSQYNQWQRYYSDRAAKAGIKIADMAGQRADLKPWKRLKLILRAKDMHQKELNIRLTGKNQSGESFEEIRRSKFSPLKACITETFALPDAERIQLQFSGATPYIDGLSVETESGVSFSTIVMRGLHQAWLLSVDEQTFRCGYEAYNPDLVIFQFGINESQSVRYRAGGFSAEKYNQQLRQFYTRLKEASPDSSILVLGAWERLIKEYGVYKTYPEHKTVRDIQNKTAYDMNLAFFNGFEFTGGTEGLRKLVRLGLIQGDYTHVTYAGGHYVADGLYNSIMADYKAWKDEAD